MSTLSSLSGHSLKPRHVYQQEIAAMLLALCAIREPDEALTQYIEDVVRNHVQQLVVQARAQALRRNAKAIAVEDLIFLVRHDRARLNRLRTYLSWKDVRKKMRELDQAGGVGGTGLANGNGGAGGGIEDDPIDAIEEPVSDKSLKVIKATVRLPWELNDAWVDYLHSVDDDPEDDEAEAYEVNKQRLRELDLLTSRMSREEYEQYSQARQVSFVYRKNKKFRDFIALPAILDVVAPQDEVLDVLGFLSYECVRALCDAGVAHKKSVDGAKQQIKEYERRRAIREGKKRSREVAEGEAGDATMEDGSIKHDASSPATAGSHASPGEGRSSPRKDKDASVTRKGLDGSSSMEKQESSPKRRPLEVPTSLFSAPLPDATAAAPAFGNGAASAAAAGPDGTNGTGSDETTANDFAARFLFDLNDVELGLHAVDHTYGSLKTSGMRNWRGGISRLPTRLV